VVPLVVLTRAAANKQCLGSELLEKSEIGPGLALDVFDDVGTPKACCALCGGNKQCHAWSLNTVDKRCTLKNASRPVVPSAHCVSWVDDQWPNVIEMDHNFFWAEDLKPVWTSVFMRTSDVILDFDWVDFYLQAVRPGEMDLVSLVGAMVFPLELISRHHFKQITFFDMNVNEFSKLRLIQNSLRRTPFSRYDYFRDVDSQIREAPEQFYLPRAMADDFTFSTTEGFVFPPPGWHATDKHGVPVPPVKMWSLLPPDSKCGDVHSGTVASVGCAGAWRPESEAVYQQAQRGMASCGQTAYLGLPSLRDTAKIVVVFLDGIFCKSEEHPTAQVMKMLQELYPDAKMILPIRSHCEGHPADAMDDTITLNNYIHDPHFWWMGILSLYMPVSPGTPGGGGGASLHVWPPEYAQFVGGEYDTGFTYSNTVDEFLAIENFNAIDTIVVHILLGTHQVDRASGAAACTEREAMLGRVIRQAARVASHRLVIADHNGELPEFGATTCAVAPQALERIVQASGGGSAFRVVDTRFVPGEKQARRNVFVVADKDVPPGVVQYAK
jgi:hypothetical protein